MKLKMGVKILVVFYSMTGNVAKLSSAVADGAKDAGAEVRLRQVEEIIPKNKWDKRMRAVKESLKKIPFVTNDDLLWADGIAFGTPTRFGNVSAQLKNFIDGTGGLWFEGKLINKVATMFTSVSTQHGGHETTITTGMIPLFHHGMILIGIPYSEKELLQTDEIGGGSPYGASSVSGVGANREPTENDIHLAKVQGERLVKITKLIQEKNE